MQQRNEDGNMKERDKESSSGDEEEDYSTLPTSEGDDNSHSNDDNELADAVHPDAIVSNNYVCPFFYHEDDGDPMAFCCAKCRCSPERRALYKGRRSQQNANDYYHRHCCHKIRGDEVKDTWVPPLQEVQDGIQQRYSECLENEESYPRPQLPVITKREFRSLANTDTQVKNNDDLELAVDLLLSNEHHCKNQRKFEKEVQVREKDPRPAVVLDMFAGIGAGLVVLKRLEIAVSKVFHVEHDKIAEHVVRHRHDKSYNSELSDDGIQHIFISKFEEIERNLDHFLKYNGRTYMNNIDFCVQPFG